MKRKLYFYALMIFVFGCYAPLLRGAEEKQMPPALVVVSEVTSGMLAPETEFIGTVYYLYVSDVASEVSGKVDRVRFEEGERVKKGDVLVHINADLLKKTIKTKRASYGQVISDLELSRRNLKRIENLYREEAVSEQVYDEHRFKVSSLENRAASIKAELDRDRVELRKKFVRSPFHGVVINKQVDIGEWLSPGTTVATIARDDIIDVVVNVPQELCQYISSGMSADIEVDGKHIEGKVFAVIAQADISTRSVPVRIRVQNTTSLIAGMEARVSLPRGKKIETLMVDRDAVVNAFGKNVLFAVIDSQAKMLPVKITGYSGMTAGVEAPGLEEGMKVVVKGNERLREGQPVALIHEGK